MMEEKTMLNIASIYYNSKDRSDKYNIVLTNYNFEKALIIVIGQREAKAIASYLDWSPSKNSRDIYDLYRLTLDTFDIKLSEVFINKYFDYNYSAKLIFREKEIQIDTGIADSLALAVKHQCPIYTTNKILNSTGYDISSSLKNQMLETTNQISNSAAFDGPNQLEKYNMKKLSDLMIKAETEENYEMAAIIRDEIKKRKIQKQ